MEQRRAALAELDRLQMVHQGIHQGIHQGQASMPRGVQAFDAFHYTHTPDYDEDYSDTAPLLMPDVPRHAPGYDLKSKSKSKLKSKLGTGIDEDFTTDPLAVGI